MKKLLYILLPVIYLLNTTPTLAQGSKHPDSAKVKLSEDSLKKEQAARAKVKAEKADTGDIPGAAKDKPNPKAELKEPVPDRPINYIVVICFFAVMILLLIYFFGHLKANHQRIGFQSIKFIGLTLIFPGICILALVGGENALSGQTLAALLGTIAGYVLSKDDDSKDNSRAANQMRDDFSKKEKDYKETITKLEEELKKHGIKAPNE